jgi:hypothetical protein
MAFQFNLNGCGRSAITAPPLGIPSLVARSPARLSEKGIARILTDSVGVTPQDNEPFNIPLLLHGSWRQRVDRKQTSS